MKKVKVKGEGEERKAKKPKMTAEQKQLLAAANSFGADVGRAKEIATLAASALGEMCRTCTHKSRCAAARKKVGCLATLNCRIAAIAAVAVGMIQEGGAK